MTTKTRIILTMGSPTGIGPEIAVSAIDRVRDLCDLTIIGNEDVLKAAADLKKIPHDTVIPNLVSLSLSGDWREPKEAGRISFDILKHATEMVCSRRFDALVTAPINKWEWCEAGVPFTGHTEFLADATRSRSYAMMMASPRLRVTLATIHKAIRHVPECLTVEKIVTAGTLTHRILIDGFGIREPRIAVAALNPHAGEKGLFGDEEETIIQPAIQRLHEAHINATGPFPGDTVFAKAARGAYDAVVAMYHDQGLAAIKTLDSAGTVNVTLGLPIIRTSVDHGTANDIAWKGVADPANFIHAITLAVQLSDKSQRVFTLFEEET